MDGIRTMVSGKSKVIVVMGATATGKSKLAIDLALRFDGEVINSDKIQVYDGLDVVTNKVTVDERAGIPHHLIGGVHPDADYSAADFCRDAMRAVESIRARGRLPIIAGGSNSYVEALVDGEQEFRRRYNCCFLWVDADLPVLHEYVCERVDRMVEHGLVDEVRALFRPDADYSRGIRRSIGAPEMDLYFRMEAAGLLDDDELRAHVLTMAIDEIKANTCKLTFCQLQKIHRLRTLPGWNVHRLDSSSVLKLKLKKINDIGVVEAEWEAMVARPGAEIVETFFCAKKDGEHDDVGDVTAEQSNGTAFKETTVVSAIAAVVAAAKVSQVDSAAPGRGIFGVEATV